MGLAVFIDDYANTMIVGSAMRPLCDRHRISREKLAFLVDATSAPIAGVAVISTWIGYEVGLFENLAGSLGIDRSGYSIFFDALGYRFYCFLMIIFVLAGTVIGGDYGPMRRAARRAREGGALFAADARPMTSRALADAQADAGARVRGRTALLPIAGLFLFLLAALWIDGGGGSPWDVREGIFSPAAWRRVMGAAENNILILAGAAAWGLVVAVWTSRGIARLSWRRIGGALAAGARGSCLPLAILVLAWSLKSSCDALGTGAFLVDAVGETLSPRWFPALVFALAGATAFATGTSWGVMAILIPMAGPIAFELDGGHYGLTTMMTLGAVLDGAILGDHCSPISDTTIMSSISSGCDHIHHVTTQIPYSLTVGGCALAAGYIPAAHGLSPATGLLLGGALLAAPLLVARRAGARPAAAISSQ
jgi:Na+/H+ antiporter NhaC